MESTILWRPRCGMVDFVHLEFWHRKEQEKMERWVLLRKGADFLRIGKKFGISPQTACLIRNRDIVGDEAVDAYLNHTIADLHDGMLMKDMDRAVELLLEKLREGAPIRVIGDYDIDGVCATYILVEGLRGLGGCVDMDIPNVNQSAAVYLCYINASHLLKLYLVNHLLSLPV